jgi:tryptophan synthase beta chain
VTEPHSISAGLDYPGIGPLHAYLFESGRARFLSATDHEALDAAFELARLEGIIPALESAHALAKLKDLSSITSASLEVKQYDEFTFAKNSIVVICLSGRGDKDMAAYMKKMENEK